MKKVLLQNHPGSEKYSFNGWEIFNSNFERMIKENKAMLLCKWGFYLTCVVAVMFVFAAITSNGLNERGLIRRGSVASGICCRMRRKRLIRPT
ncbi:hypothetical protein ACUOBA_36830, partial [Escherichia coli]